MASVCFLGGKHNKSGSLQHRHLDSASSSSTWRLRYTPPTLMFSLQLHLDACWIKGDRDGVVVYVLFYCPRVFGSSSAADLTRLRSSKVSQTKHRIKGNRFVCLFLQTFKGHLGKCWLVILSWHKATLSC